MQNKGLCRIIAASLLWVMANTQAQALPPLTHGLTPITPPVTAPALKLDNMDEESINLLDFHGRVVVVNFWATWCPPCRREMPSLERLYLATADQNLVVLAVNVGEDEDTVFPFMGELDPSPTFPVIYDYDGEVAIQWLVKGMPTTYIIDPEGKVAYRAIGGREFDHPDIINLVRTLQEAFKAKKQP